MVRGTISFAKPKAWQNAPHPGKLTLLRLLPSLRAFQQGACPILARRDAETSNRIVLAHERRFAAPRQPSRSASGAGFSGHRMMHNLLRDVLVVLFATTGGLTLSGIAANLYRLLGGKPQSKPQTVVYYAVMAVAGPSVLFENATRSFRTKACTALAYAFAVAVSGYWSFALGLLILSLCMHVR